MQKRLPYLPLFVGDFLASTPGWSLLERGALLMLMFAEWENGPLPAEMRRLAAIVGLSEFEFAPIWPAIEKKFTQTEAGLIVEALEERREKYRSYTAKQAENGQKGMKSRWKCPQCDSKLQDGRCLSCGYQKPPKQPKHERANG